MPELSLTVNRVIPVTAERIFNAWLDPTMMARYMAFRPDIQISDARSDARVGGRFHFIVTTGDKNNPHGGTYTTITPHSHLVFTWESPFSAPGSTVDISLRTVAGGTEVSLTHQRFLSEDSREGHRAGWTGILASLDAMMI